MEREGTGNFSEPLQVPQKFCFSVLHRWGMLWHIYLLGRYLDSQQWLIEMCLSLDHPCWLHGPPSSFLVEGNIVMPGTSSPDCQVPRCARTVSGQVGSRALPQQWSEPAPQPLTASNLTFAFISFHFCTAGLLPGQTAESAASAAAQLQVTQVRGAAWGQERPLGQQQPTMRFDVKLHLYPAAPQLVSADTPRERESPFQVNTGAGRGDGGVAGSAWAAPEIGV